MATATETLDRTRICDVWVTLGGSKLHHGRGRAFWRGGDGYSVAVNQAKGLWYDFARAEGGGVLALVETVRGCDRRDALRWLADHLGIRLDDRPLTGAERRKYTQRRAQAQAAAHELTDWRRCVLRELRDERTRLFMSENIIAAAARTLLASEDGADDDEGAWSEIWRCALDHLEADAIDREIQRLESATPAELVKIRQAAA